MRNEFCTLFDANYLPRGLVLYRSLERHCDEFRLRVFCMDDETKQILDRLALPHLTAVGLDELEAHDSDLLTVKPTRTQVEYCWTATPAVCAYALETEPELETITYLDADLMFFRDPDPIWQEFGDDSVLIVPHRYAPQWQKLEETNGTYNVEFMTFRRDQRGLEALNWWRDRCLEWCYHRFEDGKMGDQKYLDDWPDRFAGVHVLEHPGAGLAPWNVSRYRLEQRGERIAVDGEELVFFHYHSLRLFEPRPVPQLVSRLGGRLRSGQLLWTADYPISTLEERLIWAPYLRNFHEQWDRVRSLAPGVSGGVTRWSARKELARRTPPLTAAGARRFLNRRVQQLSRLASSARNQRDANALAKRR